MFGIGYWAVAHFSDDYNPGFSIVDTVFVIDYEMGEDFSFAVSIFDENERTGNSKPMGSAVFDMGQVLGARGSTKAKALKGNGTVFATARKSTGAGTLRLKIRGEQVRACLHRSGLLWC